MKKTPLLSIVLIGYNSKFFLNHCLKGVEQQTFKNSETWFIDNASSDESVGFVKKKFPWVKIVANPENNGYVGAANQGIRMTESKYVMILNPDLIMTPTYLEKIIQKMEKDPKIAAITGKALKYDFKKDKPTNFIDTTGLYCFRNRRIIDRGQGLKDEGQYDKEEEVFGVSGAVPIYRREALEDAKLPMLTKNRLQDFDYCSSTPAVADHPQVCLPGRQARPSDSRQRETQLMAAAQVAPKNSPRRFEYFDEDFFMYKEDVDLSWRFLLLGWKCYYYPEALCYHGRGTGVLKRFTHWEVYKGRKELNRFQKYYAYKNQRLMQIKNELWGNFLKDIFAILAKEILIFGYILVREPYLLKAFGTFLKQIPNALRKRRLLMKRRRVSWVDMDHWLSGKAKK